MSQTNFTRSTVVFKKGFVASTNINLPSNSISLGKGTHGATAGNLAAKYASVSFATANVQVAVAHGLGTVPAGYIVVGLDSAGNVYDGTSANTATNLYVRCTATNAAAKLIIIAKK